ncbi:hypothetical protein IscW_ISCW018211, partial [Ixodes scapularis]
TTRIVGKRKQQKRRPPPPKKKKNNNNLLTVKRHKVDQSYALKQLHSAKITAHNFEVAKPSSLLNMMRGQGGAQLRAPRSRTQTSFSRPLPRHRVFTGRRSRHSAIPFPRNQELASEEAIHNDVPRQAAEATVSLTGTAGNRCVPPRKVTRAEGAVRSCSRQRTRREHRLALPKNKIAPKRSSSQARLRTLALS